jgi:hypothetical protein
VTVRLPCSRLLAGDRWWIPVVAAASLVHAWITSTKLDSSLYFDAIHTYLPLAREFSTSGWRFLLAPESARVPPLSYLWPALFAADPDTIKHANIVASALIPFLLFDAGRKSFSCLAGSFAAWLYATSPLVSPWIPQVLSEPPFLVFTAIWIWALAYVCDGNKRFIPVAALACGFSLLTRPIWFYPVLLSIPLLWLWLKWRRERAGVLVGSQLLGLVLPAAILAKNLWLFGLPMIAVGAGAALYYGNHPMTGGIDPPLLLLGYDHAGGDHLSFAGDHNLKAIGLDMIASKSIADNIAFFWHKLEYNVLFTPFDLPQRWWNDRAFRIAELVFAGAGYWALRGRIFGTLLGIGVVLQLIQHLPLLYNQRYSIGALELPLTLLAGTGLAVTMVSILRGRTTQWAGGVARNDGLFSRSIAFLVIAMTVVAVVAGDRLRQGPVPQPLLRGFPSEVLLDWSPAPAPAAAQTDRQGRLDAGHPALEIQIPPLPLTREDNQAWELEISMSPGMGERCREVNLAFMPASGYAKPPERSIPLKVLDDGVRHRYAVGATRSYSPLFPGEPGILRARLDCPEGAVANITRVRFVQSRLHEYYRNFLIRH